MTQAKSDAGRFGPSIVDQQCTSFVLRALMAVVVASAALIGGTGAVAASGNEAIDRNPGASSGGDSGVVDPVRPIGAVGPVAAAAGRAAKPAAKTAAAAAGRAAVGAGFGGNGDLEDIGADAT